MNSSKKQYCLLSKEDHRQMYLVGVVIFLLCFCTVGWVTWPARIHSWYDL